MGNWFIDSIYKFMRGHKVVCTSTLILVTGLLAFLVTRLTYKEDITDFLPLDKDYQNALRVYEEISGGDKVIAVFMNRDSSEADPDVIVEAIDDFTQRIEERDTANFAGTILTQIDEETISEVAEFIYRNIPYFLTDRDYERIDSIMRDSDAITKALAEDRERLMMPYGGMTGYTIGCDPVGLFGDVFKRLETVGSDMSCETYDGHIFSPDMSRGIAIISSSFGAMESDHNAELSAMLQECADSTMTHYGNVEIHLTGGPVIAANNANQIKRDSITAVVISIVLIFALLYYVFGSIKDISLIIITTCWGWLFAVGGLACIHDNISIIVLGISSVIIGIAVNYPLHYLCHLQHTPDRRVALLEIASPLIIGNITTVGAFLTLVPLQSSALCDLGLFASMMLIGTILFVLIWLPHMAEGKAKQRVTIFDKWSGFELENKTAVKWIVAILTIVLGYMSINVDFDPNMGNINYMTDSQKKDIEYFERQMSQTGPERKIYAITTGVTSDSALARLQGIKNTLDQIKDAGKTNGISYCGDFLCSKQEQERRLTQWAELKAQYGQRIAQELPQEAERAGFADDAFVDFEQIISSDYEPQGLEYFSVLSQSLFTANICQHPNNNRCDIVSILDVKESDYEEVKSKLTEAGAYAFDVPSLNSAVADHLSKDFNYIGFACGFVVFIFLWRSLSSLELALLSFLPMALSWLWILGIMSLLDIKFNIVNIILATFIFGQGDDYTIFMTEGASYEYTYRKKMLASYKSSIIISALIMLIGIGTLIIAQHPALKSLATVTIAGMTSVVLMAYIFPPLVFKFLTQKNGRPRLRPVKLMPMLCWSWYKLTSAIGHPVIVGAEVEISHQAPKRQSIAVCIDESIDSRVILAKYADIAIGKDIETEIKNGKTPLASMADAVTLAQHYKLDITPVSIYGMREAMPQDSPCIYTGKISIKFGDPIKIDNVTKTSDIETACIAEYTALRDKEIEANRVANFIIDRYKYRFGDIPSAVRKNMRRNSNFSKFCEEKTGGRKDIVDDSYGEKALIYAYIHRDVDVTAIMENEEKAIVLKNCAEDIVANLTIVVK